MKQKQQAKPLPRRVFIASAGLALAAPLLAHEADAAPPPLLGTVQVTISGKGTIFRTVTAHFALPDGSTLPFYAWNVDGAATRFPISLTRAGLHVSVEGEAPQELVLRTAGTHVLTRNRGTSELKITLTPV